ncbi:MAG: hypothetical protein WCO35_00345 [Candidatus Nomurabacteria bacterium]
MNSLNVSQLLGVLEISLMLSLVFFIFLYFRNKDIKVKLKKAEENLGRPCLLKEVAVKIFNLFDDSKPSNIFYLNSCVLSKKSEEDKEFTYFKHGTGLISNPDYKYSPIYTELLFKFEEIIEPDSLYILRYDESIQKNYLEKVKTS